MNETKGMSNSTGVLLNTLIQYGIDMRGKCQIVTVDKDDNVVALTFTDHACAVHTCPPKVDGRFEINLDNADAVFSRGQGCNFLEDLAENHHANYNAQYDPGVEPQAIAWEVISGHE